MRNGELEQEARSSGATKLLLTSRTAHLERVKQQKETISRELYVAQEENRELKLKLREHEARRLASTSNDENAAQCTSLADELFDMPTFDVNEKFASSFLSYKICVRFFSSDGVVKLRVENEDLRSSQRALKDELERMKTYVEVDKQQPLVPLLAGLFFGAEISAMIANDRHLNKSDFAYKPKRIFSSTASSTAFTKPSNWTKCSSTATMLTTWIELLFVLILFYFALRVAFCFAYDEPFTFLGTYTRSVRQLSCLYS